MRAAAAADHVTTDHVVWVVGLHHSMREDDTVEYFTGIGETH